MKPRVQIFDNGWISVDGKFTGYNVVQREWGTSLFRDNGHDSKPRYTEIDLPHDRYSLVSEKPECGFGRSDFESDLLEIIQK